MVIENEAWLISGPSGSGKSHVVEVLHNELANRRILEGDIFGSRNDLQEWIIPWKELLKLIRATKTVFAICGTSENVLAESTGFDMVVCLYADPELVASQGLFRDALTRGEHVKERGGEKGEEYYRDKAKAFYKSFIEMQVRYSNRFFLLQTAEVIQLFTLRSGMFHRLDRKSVV